METNKENEEKVQIVEKKGIDWKPKIAYIKSTAGKLKKPFIIFVIILTLLNLFLAFFELNTEDATKYDIVKVGGYWGNFYETFDKGTILASSCYDAKITNDIIQSEGGKGHCYIRYTGTKYFWKKK